MRRLMWWYCLSLLLLATPAAAATYYLAPGGSDSASGTTASMPWRTFGFALPRLQPGDTLLLLDGLYTQETTGLPYLNCDSTRSAPKHGPRPSTSMRGTKESPITLKAQHERKAHLKGSGTNVVQLDNCTYWTIEGLYVSNIDVQVSGYEGSGIVTNMGSNITVRRTLVYGPNAWFNSHGIALYGTDATVVEENEVYYFTRHGILFGTGGGRANHGAVVRRNYLHSRGHGSMSGGYTCPGSCENQRGDEGISAYPANNLLVENNIIEEVTAATTIQCKNDCARNTYYGNIALHSGGFSGGARGEAYPNTPQQMPTDEVYEHNIVVQGDGWYANGCRVCKNSQWRNNSILGIVPGGTKLGMLFDNSCGSACGEGGDGQLTGYITNQLIVNPQGAAFDFHGMTDWSVTYARVYGASTASTPPLTDAHYQHITTTDPGLGACLVYIPSGSNLKGAGEGGKDIGATILYQYQDGVLTTTPLWHPQTGVFSGCGAIVPGVNDVAGQSCRDVHARLNVGTNGCPLPYASGAGAVVSWQAPATGGEPEQYEVWRQVGTATPVALETVPANQRTYTDTASSPQACYKVVAQNQYGETASAPECVPVQGEAPGPPQDLAVTPTGGRR